MSNIRASRVVGCLIALVVLAAPAAAQEVAGTWVLAVELDAGTGGDATFVLAVEEDEISGTYSGALGEDIAVTGQVTEEGLRFVFDSQAGEIVYEGKVEGNTMEGTCEYGQLGGGTFKGERQP